MRHFDWSPKIRVLIGRPFDRYSKFEWLFKGFMMFYAKIYGPYNFYLFQFKFWIHFRLTKTESIKEVPNWPWRRFMNKLFFGRVGVKILWKYILCKLSRDHHVTIMWPVNSFYLFVNYFTVISLRKLNFAKREHLNFFRLQQWAYVLRTYGRRPDGDVKWLSKKIFTKKPELNIWKS